MIFKGKPVKIIITGDAKEEFEKLKRVVGEELAKGTTGSDYQTLLSSINQKIEVLKENPHTESILPKIKFPKDIKQTTMLITCGN